MQFSVFAGDSKDSEHRRLTQEIESACEQHDRLMFIPITTKTMYYIDKNIIWMN
jgi:CRISPR/Cas system-associated endoribonuclease Cas2